MVSNIRRMVLRSSLLLHSRNELLVFAMMLQQLRVGHQLELHCCGGPRLRERFRIIKRVFNLHVAEVGTTESLRGRMLVARNAADYSAPCHVESLRPGR